MNKFFKYLIFTFICAAVFFILGEPCRLFLKLSETTEVRPVCALPFLFGLVFGFWGTLGCAIGNLISDIISGYSTAVLIPGFIIQLLYGYLPVLIYNHLRRNDENKYQLNRISKIIQYLIIIFADSVFSALMVYTLLKVVYGTPLFSLGFYNTFCNQLIFFIITGIPFLCTASILKQWQKNKGSKQGVISFSLSEKFILYFLGFSILISIAASLGAYQIFYQKHGNDPMTFWSYVYFVCAGALFLSLCPSTIFLYYMEKNVFDKLAKEAAEKEKNATQLKIATAIQLGALPKQIPLQEIELYATIKPALEVGGDFYDFFKIDENHLAVVIADVSGKGVPAALFMMASKIILKKNLKMGLSPAQALTNTNNELCETNPAEMFVTCLCGVLNTETMVFTYSNAGHEKPAIYHSGKEFTIGKIKSGFVLGGMPEINYKQEELQLHKGDIIFTCTDGIPEAINTNNEEFGKERFVSVLNEAKEDSLQVISEKMYNAISDFAGDAPQFDDITMLMFRIK